MCHSAVPCCHQQLLLPCAATQGSPEGCGGRRIAFPPLDVALRPLLLEQGPGTDPGLGWAEAGRADNPRTLLRWDLGIKVPGWSPPKQRPDL